MQRSLRRDAVFWGRCGFCWSALRYFVGHAAFFFGALRYFILVRCVFWGATRFLGARRGTPRRYKGRRAIPRPGMNGALPLRRGSGGECWSLAIARHGLPAMPDCRGGVFAVFAKIPPPIAHTRGHIRSAYLMRGRGVCSDVACRVAVWCLVPNCCGVLRRA